jgi:hypothetical protein
MRALPFIVGGATAFVLVAMTVAAVPPERVGGVGVVNPSEWPVSHHFTRAARSGDRIIMFSTDCGGRELVDYGGGPICVRCCDCTLWPDGCGNLPQL